MLQEYGDHKTQNPSAEVYEIAIRFARMWGVVETLEPLSNPGFDKIRDAVVGFAEEFIAGGQKDFEEFFYRKIDTIRREYRLSNHEQEGLST